MRPKGKTLNIEVYFCTMQQNIVLVGREDGMYTCLRGAMQPLIVSAQSYCTYDTKNAWGRKQTKKEGIEELDNEREDNPRSHSRGIYTRGYIYLISIDTTKPKE